MGGRERDVERADGGGEEKCAKTKLELKNGERDI